MSILTLSVPVEIIVKDGTEETVYKIEVKEPTKEEAKEFKKQAKEFNKLMQEFERLRTKQNSINKKQEYAEKLEDYKKALEMQEKADVIQEELEKILPKMKKLGIDYLDGGEGFLEQKAKDRFEKLVTGDDKEKLREIAEQKNYIAVMDAIDRAKANAEKKQ